MNRTPKRRTVGRALGVSAILLIGMVAVWLRLSVNGILPYVPARGRADKLPMSDETNRINLIGKSEIRSRFAAAGSMPVSRSSIETRAILDGEALLAEPTPEIRMAFNSLLRFGLPVESAKCALRPVLLELLRAAASEQRILHADNVAAGQRERVRSEDLHQGEEKDLVLKSIASIQQSERARWVAQREQATNQLMVQILAFGVADPNALFEDLLLIQPDRPLPPPPMP